MPQTFLTAYWRYLIMANYVVDPKLLKAHVPYGTELDLWQGRCYVSLVGFMFEDTKVLGLPIPWHRHFEEVNLRFYVRFQEEGEWKRGVVFIKEIVPKRAITWVANTFYGEHYQTMSMRHQISTDDTSRQISYEWRFKGEWNHLRVVAAKEALAAAEGSEANFITEHYWGYTQLGPQRTSSYEVVHPSWGLYTVESYDIHCDAGAIYGADFGPIIEQAPDSIFVADGSEVSVRKGKVLTL